MTERRRIQEAVYRHRRIADHARNLRGVRRLGLLAYFTLRLDGPRLPDERLQLRRTLLELKEEAGYDLGDKTLRRDLHELRDEDWIGFEQPSGSRRYWTFWLTGAAVDDRPVSGQCPASVRPGWTQREFVDGAKPHGYTESEPSLAGHADLLRGREVEKKRAVEEPSGSSTRDGAQNRAAASVENGDETNPLGFDLEAALLVSAKDGSEGAA